MDIEMKGIYKSFHGVPVLKNVDFSLRSGEIHALMGENGAGKSTLMKILTGMYAKDEGEIRCDGNPVHFKNPREAEGFGISFIHQELNILPNLSVAENLFLNKELCYPKTNFVKTKQMNEIASQQLLKLGLDISGNTPAGNCSVGQQQMIEIAKALMTSAKVIIMDEPTAALAEREIEILFEVIRKLRDNGVSLIYISHRMDEIFRICERITVLRDGETVGTKAVGETSFDEIVKMMVGRSIGERFPQRNVNIGKTVLSVKGLARKNVFQNISFDLREGEILGIAGLMGAGRTEIAKALFGCDKKTSGEIFIGDKKVTINNEIDAMSNHMAFVTEDRKSEGLILSFSIRDNMSLTNLKSISSFGILRGKSEKDMASGMIDTLNIRANDELQEVKSLSGGNQQKVVIGKWLAGIPRIFIMDEPTRGVDVGAKKEIYRIMNELTAKNTAILFISSELPELLGLCDRIIVIHEGKQAGILDKDMFTQENVMTLAAGGTLPCANE